MPKLDFNFNENLSEKNLFVKNFLTTPLKQTKNIEEKVFPQKEEYIKNETQINNRLVI